MENTCYFGNRRVSDEEIIEGFEATGGSLNKTCGWLLKNKGVKMSYKGLVKRLKRSLPLSHALEDIRDAEDPLSHAAWKKSARLPSDPEKADALIAEALLENGGNYRAAREYLKNRHNIFVRKGLLEHLVSENFALRTIKNTAEKDFLTKSLERLIDLVQGGPADIDDIIEEARQNAGKGVR